MFQVDGSEQLHIQELRESQSITQTGSVVSEDFYKNMTHKATSIKPLQRQDIIQNSPENLHVFRFSSVSD